MKQDNNNEIDLLLRAFAGRERGESPLGGKKVSARADGIVSDHLDADELSSFAEGVVPAPAKTRYVAHLADCESCRGFVVNLRQASGAAAVSETLEQQTGASFWQRVASLFSPPALRYAVPALALTAVIAVSFFALRQQRRPDLIAQSERTNSAAPVSAGEQPPESQVAQSNIEAPANSRSGAESPAGIDVTRERKSFQDEKGSVQTPVATPGADAATVSPLKDLAQSKQAYGAGAARPVYAPEPAAPPPPKAALSEADKIASIQKEELANREVQAVPQEYEKNQPRDQAGRHGPSRNNAILPGSRRADGLMTERREARAKSKKDSDDDVEMRSVSGKRFRRQGSAWIDTAYDSSRRTINLTRGSEQFRALIADEPGIRTIAEQLNGVVIVVWNGRAYRIQ